MRGYQQTIQKTTTLSGIGLHTGIFSEITFIPAPANHGIQFQRMDLPEQPLIEAQVELVSEVLRGTTLSMNNMSIHTVEHVLAALIGLEIDNVLMQVKGPEVPILDGSAHQFVEALLHAGLCSQEAKREFYTLTDRVEYKDEQSGAVISAIPFDGYQLTVTVDYDSPVLGNQQAQLSHLKDFTSEIASSRTFCFFHELEYLYQQGLIKGGDLSNAVVVVDKHVKRTELNYLAKLLKKEEISSCDVGILNAEKSRHPNEASRHKLLDILGDLALIGHPIKAKITAIKPGHASNIAFAKQLKKTIQNKKITFEV